MSAAPEASRSPFKYRDIRISVRMKAAPERVYAALTSARQLCAWWVDRAETNIRNQGRFRLVWPGASGKGRFEVRGVFADLEPDRKLSWLWNKENLPRRVPPLTNLFIEPARGGCRVTLLHSGFSARPSAEKLVARYSRGWEDCLSKLALYVESGKTCKNDKLSLAELDLLRRKKS